MSGDEIAVLRVGPAVRQVAWHPQGTRLLVGRADRTVQIWDTTTRECVAVIGDLEGPVLSAAWRGDGGQILLCIPDAILLYDTHGGRRQARVAKESETFYAAAFSPDGSRVVSAGMPSGQPRTGPEGWRQDGGPRTTLRVWDTTEGDELITIPDLSGAATTVAYSPDGRQIVASTFNFHRKFFGKSLEACELRTWDAETGIPAVTFTGHHDPLLGVACSPDGTRIASANGGFDNSVRLWDTATGRELRQLKGARAPVNSVSFTSDGTRLVTGSEDAGVRVWDVASEGQPRHLREHGSRINCVTFSADGLFLASCDGYPQMDKAPGMIKVWEPDSGRLLATLAGHTSLVWAVAFSPDGETLASVGTDHTLRQWDWRSGTEKASVAGEYACVAFAPDGRLVACAGNGILDLRDSSTGQVVRRIESAGRWCRSVAFRPDGLELAAAWDKDVVLHDPLTGDEVSSLRGHEQIIWSLAYSPDGRSIATAAGLMNNTDAAGEWKVWNVTTGVERLGAVVPGGGYRAVAWTPDGRRLITGGFDMKIRSWDARHGQPLHGFPTHSLTFTVACSPNGSTIACGTHSRGVVLFDAVPIEDCRVLHAPMGVVAKAWFTPDGRHVLARDERSGTRAWSMETGQAASADAVAAPTDGPRPVVSPDGEWSVQPFRNTVVVRPARPHTTAQNR